MARRLLSIEPMSSLFTSVGVLHRALDFHTQRHNVLTSNVANVDTPGFAPRELIRTTNNPEDRLAFDRVRSDDLYATGQSGRYEESIVEERVVRAGMDGNAVSLEREMSKIAANDLRFETATRLVRAHMGLLRYAANDAR